MSDVPATGEHGDDDEVEASRAPLLSHLVELRQRLIWSLLALGIAFVLCFAVSYQLYNFLVIPFERATERFNIGPEAGAVLNYPPLALFFARVKLSFFAGLMIAFPVIAWQMYAFVAPGLYKRERQAVTPFLVAIPFLFALGILLVHQFVLPAVMQFALSMEAPAEAAGRASYRIFVTVSDYLNLALTLMMGFGFAFQLPVIFTLLGRAGIVTGDGLAKARKYAIVAIFFAAAVLTPPDPISQIGLGLAMMGLYEISIWTVRFFAARDAKRAEEEQ